MQTTSPKPSIIAQKAIILHTFGVQVTVVSSNAPYCPQRRVKSIRLQAKGIYRDYMGVMENKMETTIVYWGIGVIFRVGGLGFRARVLRCCCDCHMGSSQNYGYHFGGPPLIRILVYWGLYWGPPVLGNYHMIAGN